MAAMICNLHMPCRINFCFVLFLLEIREIFFIDVSIFFLQNCNNPSSPGLYRQVKGKHNWGWRERGRRLFHILVVKKKTLGFMFGRTASIGK